MSGSAEENAPEVLHQPHDIFRLSQKCHAVYLDQASTYGKKRADKL